MFTAVEILEQFMPVTKAVYVSIVQYYVSIHVGLPLKVMLNKRHTLAFSI